ncbi:hypothetical protein CBR_g21975 [Chara braunii]|uniref:Leucine-rich repeat-containing N-terminal plant-type domain-containing protein n=1 Tax=Chara braunii TaxID=69332 RepID=A0A388L1P7_CHABU|nr:hypothetical protein CBR_g21975 [Chara braunii]|eukprot:GBG76227.1 hypothetical protein CBR_g21975 [Chara braunii]
MLNVLDLRNNQLTGRIPSSLEDLPNLRGLYLDNNFLSGPIPPKLRARSENGTLNVTFTGNSGQVMDRVTRVNNIGLLSQPSRSSPRSTGQKQSIFTTPVIIAVVAVKYKTTRARQRRCKERQGERTSSSATVERSTRHRQQGNPTTWHTCSKHGRHNQRMSSTAAKRKATPATRPHHTANTAIRRETHAKQAGQAAGQRRSADEDVHTSNTEQSSTSPTHITGEPHRLLVPTTR